MVNYVWEESFSPAVVGTKWVTDEIKTIVRLIPQIYWFDVINSLNEATAVLQTPSWLI